MTASARVTDNPFINPASSIQPHQSKGSGATMALSIETFESAARKYGNSLSNSFVHVAVNNRLILSAIVTEKAIEIPADDYIVDATDRTYDILDERGDVIYTTTILSHVQEFAIQMALTGARAKDIARFFATRENRFMKLQMENETNAFVSTDRQTVIIKSNGDWGVVIKKSRNGHKYTISVHNGSAISEFKKSELIFA